MADPILDPTSVARTGRPNDSLICPADRCAATADAAPAIFGVSEAELLAAWKAVIGDEPRTRLIADDPASGRLVVEQRSFVFRFVDVIAIRVLPVPGGGSTFAAYSRSRRGAYDFGVNATRLNRWAEMLRARLGA